MKKQTSFWLDATFAILHNCTEQENKKVKAFETLSFPEKQSCSHTGLSNSIWEKDRLLCFSLHASKTDKTHCPTTLNFEIWAIVSEPQDVNKKNCISKKVTFKRSIFLCENMQGKTLPLRFWFIFFCKGTPGMSRAVLGCCQALGAADQFLTTESKEQQNRRTHKHPASTWKIPSLTSLRWPSELHHGPCSSQAPL